MQDISLGKIAQIAVMVGDLDRATAFYRDKLGIQFLFNAPPKMPTYDLWLAEFRDSENNVMALMCERPKAA
jgi:catechol 2,3-dioxygenase-like lactoylglutathione lyase family enzyme